MLRRRHAAERMTAEQTPTMAIHSAGPSATSTRASQPAHWPQAPWPQPLHGLSTTARGPTDEPGFDLALRGSQTPACRRRLREALGLRHEPVWLQQVHGIEVIEIDAAPRADATIPTADACIVRVPGLAAVVLTADCLPILLADPAGTEVAAIHAGWRGLAAGVIEACVARMRTAPPKLLAWIGPAIGVRAFEVGPEVRAALLQEDNAEGFIPGRDDRWHANLPRLAAGRLRKLGIHQITQSQRCTHQDTDLHSYRRDGAQSGRMASLVWVDPVSTD